ncbi:MAG: hypothetical protein ABR936_09350 [Bacteroidota bacterium]|jgi:hypothetical protein
MSIEIKITEMECSRKETPAFSGFSHEKHLQKKNTRFSGQVQEIYFNNFIKNIEIEMLPYQHSMNEVGQQQTQLTFKLN